MQKYALILLLIATATCVVPVATETPQEGAAGVDVPPPVEAGVVEMSDPNDPVLLWDIERTEAAERRQSSPAELALDDWQAFKGKKHWRLTRRQGCQLARMGVSENSRPLRRVRGERPGTEGVPTQDHFGIAHVIINNRPCSHCRSWLDVMHKLSPHVGRQKKLTRPRQKWTSSLPCTGDDKPEGWDEDKWAGDWEVARMFWPMFRDEMIRVWVNGDIGYMPGKAIAWGCIKTERNKTWCWDPEKAKARGLCVLPDYGNLNGFWAKPGNGCGERTLPASVAAGGF